MFLDIRSENLQFDNESIHVQNCVIFIMFFDIFFYFFTLIDWAHGRGGGFCDCGILDKG